MAQQLSDLTTHPGNRDTSPFQSPVPLLRVPPRNMSISFIIEHVKTREAQSKDTTVAMEILMVVTLGHGQEGRKERFLYLQPL